MLYRVVQQHLATFLARAEGGGALPRFVRRELASFLECGVPAHGFIRVRCPQCRLDGLVAFSCKGRGFCPTCGGRRMADTAAHLVDRVLPEVPVRQRVLSLPHPLRFLLAYDRCLCTKVLSTFSRALLGWYRRRGRRCLGVAAGRSGTVTTIQRFDSALRLNLHFHVVALDGVYTETTEASGAGMRFHALAPPENEEVAALLSQVSRRILRALVQSGRLRRTEEGYEIVGREECGCETGASALESCQAASVRGRIALGPRAGSKVQRLGDRVELGWCDDGDQRSRCAKQDGFTLHGDVQVGAHDRCRLERLCRYILRPAIATERLRQRDDGRIEYELRKPWRDGTSGFVFEPEEFLERLAALVPAPRGHLVRYHGVLAPGARWRALVVRDRTADDTGRLEAASKPCPGPPNPDASIAELRERRLTWGELMHRVFAVDVLECPRCGGRRELIAVITDPAVIVAFLDSLGVPSRAPPMAPVRYEDVPEADPDPSWAELG